ncbi:hypothetical protein KDL01_26255 [Actinospica durhamensis]|uniref:Outer membrane channel protein CpnT-like N-terminal domain-containing protein n=1 Tax=Actinospica durhamensis TaxID=1508375 RepID=A0A941ETL8_9ACTN|nr:hypothetical protein [Actinospica durhamensis]MBR7836811.1 hypothetical protein [Actinospica durhamensis]
MSIVLPSELAWVLNMLGFTWPNIDEDQMRDGASRLRTLAGELNDKHGGTASQISSMLANNSSEAMREFGVFWQKLSGKHLPDVIKGLDLLAEALEVGAEVIVGMKTACIVQIGVLAGEILADQAAAAVTFGAAEAAIPEEVAVTDGILDEIVAQAKKQVVGYVEQVLLGPLFDAAKSAAENIATQLVGDALGVQSGFSLSAVGSAAKSGAETGLEGIKNMATDPGGAINQAFSMPPMGQGGHGSSSSAGEE